MNVGLQEICENLIHQLMALDGPQASELLRHDRHPEMAFAISGAGVTNMQMTVVDDFDTRRFERQFERAMDALRTGELLIFS